MVRCRMDIESAAKCSPLLHVSPDDPPTLLVVGAKDELVPMKHSQDIHRAFEEKSVASRLAILEDADHGFQGADRERAVNELVAWFNEHLVKKQGE